MHQQSMIVLAIALALAATTASSQETERASSAASRGVMQDRSHLSAAEALYVEKCSMCHREMGMGTILLARRWIRLRLNWRTAPI